MLAAATRNGPTRLRFRDENPIDDLTELLVRKQPRQFFARGSHRSGYFCSALTEVAGPMPTISSTVSPSFAPS